MPDHLRGFIVILVLAAFVFAFASKSARTITESTSFSRRRNLWFAITFAAFLSPNYWVYAFAAISLMFYASRKETNTPAMFFFILFALPANATQIPGFGVFESLFDISHARMLEIFILFPAYYLLRRDNESLPFGRTASDKILAAYLFLCAVLYLRDANVTSSLRQAFYLFFDIFVPYVVVSRSLKDMQSFRNALLSFVLATMVLALVAVFESLKHWLLYQPLVSALQMGDEAKGYALIRDGMMRVVASAGQPIVLGYLMVVGMGLYLFVQQSIQQKILRRAGLLLLTAGLIAPLSRGPWVGAVVLIIVFYATGRNPVRHLMKLAFVIMFTLPLIAILPGSERMINLLPFIGSTENENVDYRKKLITNSMIVIQQNPWFGSTNYLDTPEMEDLRQGQGIIDIVNSYIGIALKNGFIGLGLFVGFFVLVIIDIYRAMRSIPDRSSEEYLLGQALFATLLAILTIIFTVSSISYIPIVYWSVAGLGVAYAQIARKRTINALKGSTP